MRTAVSTLLLALFVPCSVSSQPTPPLVSPGVAGGVGTVDSDCPTFSWGQVEGARGYDLAVYRLRPDGETSGEQELMVLESFPRGVSSWTPGGEACFRPGVDHAWSVRAREGEWSRPKRFRVAAPTPEELEGALRVVRRHLVASGEVSSRELRAIGGASPSASSSTSTTDSNDADRPVVRVASSGGLFPSQVGLRATAPDAGVTLGVVGVSESFTGAGLAAENTAGGADLLLGGVAANLAMTESTLDVVAASARTFDFRNSGPGSMMVTVGGLPLFTTANDGGGSGLDADLLDGLEASGFALFNHDHDGRYARLESAAGNQSFDGGTLYLDFSANRIGINDTSPSAALDVSGDASANSFRTRDTQKRYLALPPSLFSPDSDSQEYALSSGYWYTTGATISATAPVSLPEEVTVTQFRCYLYDNLVGTDVLYTLSLSQRLVSGTSSDGMASIAGSTSGASAGIQPPFDSSISNAKIANATYSYRATVVLLPSPLDNNFTEAVRFYGCEIEYDWTELTN